MSDQVAEIKSKVDIASIIGERVQLKQRGRRFLALCPFHSEKTPSFTVSPELGIFKCFGCGFAGDAFTFLERYEGMSFVESLEYLADRVGIKLERRVVDSQLAAIDRQIFEVNHLAAEYFHFLLTKHKVGDRARQYLAARNVSQAAIDHYFLGYAPARWDALLTFLIKKGYKAELLEKAGLVIRRTKETGQQVNRSTGKIFAALQSADCYDRFRGRVMFPLRDPRGQIIGFAGRILSGEKEAKYINSPETPVYHKGKHLFGVFENKEEVRKEDRVVLVEGELDVISSWQASVHNTVAVKGTALTQDQVKLIRRYTRNVTIALDADDAGWEALIRSLPILESQGMNVRVAVMRDGKKDPDEFAKADPSGWRTLVKQALNVYEALISGIIARVGVDNGEQKKEVSESLIPILSGISNVIEQDHWIGKVAQRLNVREESVRRQMEVWRSGVSERPKAKGQGLREGETKKTKLEVLSRYLLALLIQMGKPVPDDVQLEWFSPVGIQKIISKISHKAGSATGGKELRESLPEELHDLFDDAALTSIAEDSEEEVQRVVVGLEHAWIREQLTKSRTDPAYVSRLTKRLKEIQA